MSRFLDQIRKAKEAQQRAASEQGGESPVQPGVSPEADRSLVPEAPASPSRPPQPEAPPIRGQALFPGELERKDHPKESEPSPSGDLSFDLPALFPPDLADTAESTAESVSQKSGAAPQQPQTGLVPEALADRLYGEERRSAKEVPPKRDGEPLVPESLAEKRPTPRRPQAPPASEKLRPLVPESLAEQRPVPPRPQTPSATEKSRPLVPESLAEQRPVPPRPLRPPVSEKPQTVLPETPAEEHPVAKPGPSPWVAPPLPAVQKPVAPEVLAPTAQAFASARSAPPGAAASPERKPPIPMAAPEVPRESRETPRTSVPPRRRPEKDLFPKELEVRAPVEDEEFEEGGAGDVFPSEDRAPAPSAPRPGGAPSGERLASTTGRRRPRREIAISGPEVDPDFVRRVAKIAMRPDTRVVAFYRPKHNVCEEYRLLGKNILHTFNGATGAVARGRIVSLTSSVRNEGKTLTCVNLAMTLAQDFKDRVLLMDGDMRHPRIHTYVGSPAGTGLNDLLASSDPASILEDCLLRTDMGLHLLLASSSRGNPAPLLDSHQATQLFNLLRDRYALVIVDTPPVLLATDALTVGLKSDGMLFLIRAGKTKREQIQEARQRIARLDIRMLGYVMNKVRTFLPRIWQERFYYYGHY